MKRGYADTPEGQLHYCEEGAGEPLLILHATGSSRSLMKLMPLLSKRYRVFAIDSFGERNSDPLPPEAQIPDLAEAILGFLDSSMKRGDSRDCHGVATASPRNDNMEQG